MPRVLLHGTCLRSWLGRWSIGPDQPRLQGNLLCRKGCDPFTKNRALGMGNPTLGSKTVAAIRHSVAQSANTTIHMSPMVVARCSLSVVVDNRPSAAFWFSSPATRPTESRDGNERSAGGAVRTRRVPTLPSHRHPERSLSRGRNWLAFGSAVPAAHCPGTGPARWLRDQLLASTGKLAVLRHAQNGRYPPKKLSPCSCAICAIIPTP